MDSALGRNGFVTQIINSILALNLTVSMVAGIVLVLLCSRSL